MLPSGFHLKASILLVLSVCFATSCPCARHMFKTLVSLAVASKSTVGLQARSLAVTWLLKELSLKSSSWIGDAIHGAWCRRAERVHRGFSRVEQVSESIYASVMSSLYYKVD